MTKHIYIKLKDGERETELKLEEIDQEHQLSILDGMFKFFDIDVDFKELADIYHRSGKAYQEFYAKMDANKSYKEEVSNVEIDSKQYAETLKELQEHTNKEKQDYFVTGIKHAIGTDTPLYKCRYKCSCGKEGNHYIRLRTRQVKCWECQTLLKVQPATVHGEFEGFGDPEDHRDSNGNFYVAGNYRIEGRDTE